MANNFSLSLKSVDDVIVMMPKGYVNDLGAASMEQASEDFLDQGSKKIVINFSDTQYINSIGASVITDLVQKNLEHNSVLCFTNIKKPHQNIFEMLGITKHVKIFTDEKDALSFLEGRSEHDKIVKP